jgi:phage tail protein X
MASTVTPHTTRALQGDTVDRICHRHYGRTDSITEAVYEANPGLAELGPILPHGQLVNLPAIENTPQGKENRLNLWD